MMMLAAAARIRLRSARITTWVTAWITWFADVVRICIAGYCAAVLQCVRRLDLFREQTRESRADRVLLRFHCHEASREHTELHRNDDFLFAADAQRDDEVSGDLTICIDCQVSAAVVGRQPCLAGRIAELRETRQKRSVRCRRHADFKEVCKYQRLAGVCHIDCGRDCKHGFDAAAVSKQQIQLDDDIACDADVLRPEDRGTHTFIITFAGLCVQQFLRKVSV